MATLSSTGPFPASYATFSSAFAEPDIPDVAVELRGNWIQHKWDENVSHIAAGYWYNSKSQAKVRVDETYDGALGSSLFDYTDINSSGQVLNKQYLLQPSVGSTPDCFNDHITDPGFPLVIGDFLRNLSAVFGGVVQDSFMGWAQSVSKFRSALLESIVLSSSLTLNAKWNVLFGGSIPAIIYLDANNILLGYDLWGAERRTKVTTRFFNIVVGKMDEKVFEKFPC
jgi:hypothetical protein